MKKKKSVAEMTITRDNLAETVQVIGGPSAYDMLVNELAKGHGAELGKQRDIGYRQGWQAGAFWNNCLLFFAAACSVCVVGGCILWMVARDNREHEREMSACRNGDTLGCIAAIQDQTSQVRSDNRVQLLRKAYRLKTGHSIEDATQ